MSDFIQGSSIEEPQRVSRRYMPVFFLRNIKAWAVMILIYVIGPVRNAMLDDAAVETGEDFVVTNMHIALIVIPAVIGLTILFSFLSYRRIRWWMTSDSMCIKKGILHRVDKRIPASRIQSVNITESLPERMFNVCTLEIDTAGGEGDDGKIPCLEKPIAVFLRDRIFALKGEAPFEAPDADAEVEALPVAPAAVSDGAAPAVPNVKAHDRPDSETHAAPSGEAYAPQLETIYKMPVKNLVLTGVSGSKTFAFAAIIFGVFTQFADVISALFLPGEDVYGSAWGYITSLAVPLIVLLFVIFFIICWAISVLASMSSNAGFTIRNAGAKIEIERGLISHKTISIEKNRIQEVIIRQGFIRKLIGYCEIRVKTASLNIASTEESFGTTILHPFISAGETEYFISMLLPDFSGVPEEYAPLPKIAHFRSVFRWCLWTALFEAAFWFVLSGNTTAGEGYFSWIEAHPAVFFGTSIPVLAFFAFTGHLSYIARGIGRNDVFLSVRTGAWGREWSYIPRRKVQTISLRENPFQRHAGLATLEGSTGALGFLNLLDIGKPAGEDILKWASGQKPAKPAA